MGRWHHQLNRHKDMSLNKLGMLVKDMSLDKLGMLVIDAREAWQAVVPAVTKSQT